MARDLIPAALLLLALLALGCASKGFTDLTARQRAVQNCLVQGGHPRLGPDDTIICL